MKILLLTLALFSSAMALGVEYDSNLTKIALEGTKPGACVQSNLVTMVIVKAVDPHHYQTVSMYGRQVVARGLLETTKTILQKPGEPNIYVTYLGAKDFPLENGFTAKFGLWRECE